MLDELMALYFNVKHLTVSKDSVSKQMGPLVKLLTDLLLVLHVLSFKQIMYCNLIINIITFLHLFYRLLIMTFVFGWGKGTVYRHLTILSHVV